jgi:hypothetical protein
VSPPWCAETHLQRRYRKHAGDRGRCAGERHCSHGRVTTGGLRPPLLYLAARAFVRKIATFAMHERNGAGAAGVSPPWCAETHLQGRYCKHAPDRRRCADERYRNYGRESRGAYAPRSCVARMRVCWRFAVSGARALPNHGGLTPPLLAVHAFVHRESRHYTGTRSRLQTGAAGVSPPWCAGSHLQGRYRKRAGDCRRWAGERRRNHGRPTTGG